MYKIFVYGTLKFEYLQNKLLGHTLESYDAKLEGYSINPSLTVLKYKIPFKPRVLAALEGIYISF